MAALKEDLIQIGQLVKHLRSDRSQSWLANFTGTTIPVISNIENGKRPIPKKKVAKFAEALGVGENALAIRSVTADSIQDDLKEIGLAFRGLKELPEDAREELVRFYRSLKDKHLGGETIEKKSPADEAAQVLKKCGIKKVPVDLQKIISAHKIRFEEEQFTSLEADGLFICSPNKEFAAIKVRANLNPGRKNFTIAHELGHYFLSDGLEAQMNCTPDRPGDKVAEQHANEFASHLLMPRSLLKKALPKKLAGVETLRKLSKKFGVSLEAVGRTLVEVYTKDCAFFVSDAGQTTYFRLSKSLYAKNGALPKGTQLNQATQVAKIIKAGAAPTRPEPTKADFWFRQKVRGNLKESSMRTYGQKTISLVWKG